MSEKNGDKARFAKQRQSKIRRRKRLQLALKATCLESKAEAIPAEPR